jgi:acyl carrier protein
MMNDNQILAILQEAFELAAPEKAQSTDTLKIDSALSEFGISSIAALEMAGHIEEKLNVQFPDDELSQIDTVRGFVSLIHKNIN